MAADAQSRFRIFAMVILSIVTVISLAPVASVVTAGLLASYFHCQVDEGGVHPCAAFETDIGETLYTMGVLGWLMLITIPVFVFVVIGWVVLFATRPRG
jgi:hypothetical protein